MDAPDLPASFFVQAEYSFTSPDGSALSFAPGDVIEVLTQLDSGWWDGLLVTGERGWFPSNYVTRITDAEAEDWFVARDQAGQGDGQGLFFDPDAGVPALIKRRSSVDSGPDGGELNGADVADFWIPSMTLDGQIYYHNTQTGQDAWELPTLEPEETTYDRTEHLVVPPSSSSSGVRRIPPRGSSTGIQNSTLMNSDYNLAALTSPPPPPLTTSTEIPVLDPPWELRMRNNGAGWYYFNTVTGDVKTDRALMQQHGTTSTSTGMTRTVSEPQGLVAPQATVSTTSTSRRPSTAGSSSASKGPRGVRDIAEDALRGVFGIRNKTLRRESKASLIEQRRGDGPLRAGGSRSSAGSIPTRSSSRMEAAVVQGVSVAGQGGERPVGREETAGLFWTQGGAFEDDVARRRGERDQVTVREYVDGIQVQLDDAVHAAEQHLLALQTPDQHLASLSLSDAPPMPSDIPISQRPTAQALRTSVAALVPLVRQLVHATRHALIGLDQVILETLPAHTDFQTRQSLAYLSPETLHHPQRRLVAALSKIIFFTHSAAGTDWPLGGTAERLALDTRDLGAAVRMYVDEVVRVGCLADPARGKGLKRPPVVVVPGAEESVTPGGAASLRVWRTLDDTAVRDLLALVAAVRPPSEGAVTLEVGKSLIGQVDKVFHFLQNVNVLAVLDVDEDGLVGWEEYAGAVREAKERVDEYSDGVCRVHSGAGELLLLLVDQDEAPLTETVHALRAAMDDVTTILPSLLTIAKRQAELVPSHLAGRIGAQSTGSVEGQQKHHANRQSSSTRSSLASLASVRDRPGTRYYPAGSLDPSGYTISRSQTSLPARSMSRTDSITAGSRNSASSSLTSLSQTDDYTYNYSRNSGIYGKPERSMSINKKKLAKMLGEDEFGDTLFTQVSRPAPEEKPFYLNVDYAEDDIIINPDGSIKAGTLPALVERLTLHESMDPTFNSTFLMTYRSFATAEEVLNLLIKRYQLQPPPNLNPEQLKDWAERKQKPVKLRVFNILKTWLDQHYNENMDADILEGILEFATDIMGKDTQVRMPSQQLVKAVQRRQSDGDILLRRMTTTLSNAPAPIVPKVSSGKPMQLQDVNPLELARQMTLMESQLYNRIRPVDCLNKAWSQTDRPEAGANIKAMILTSNRIAGWVAEAILVHTDAKKRASVMKHFVQTAGHCRMMNNFSTMAAIMAGLNSTPIRRLHRTRSLLSAKTMSLFDDLDKTLDSGKNFAGYRERLKRVDPPCIPFLGVYLTFLTFIEDGNANFLPAPSAGIPSSTPSTSASNLSLHQQAQESSLSRSSTTDEPTAERRLLIHFSKRQKAADVIREIQQYQAIPYALTGQLVVQNFISERLQSVEDGPDLYEISLQLEPREREDEKIARMLRESGMI